MLTKSSRLLSILISCAILLAGCGSSANKEGGQLRNRGEELRFEINKTEEEWKQVLTPEEFKILRKKGTEPAFTGDYHDSKKKGLYVCAACENELYHSDEKYDSGTGWPSFWAPVSEKKIVTKPDNSLFMRRTEVLCARCGGHLGHVFDDGPQPTGLRHCINSIALDFQEGKENPFKSGS